MSEAIGAMAALRLPTAKSAAEQLASLCGLDARHFAPCRPAAEKGAYGVAALVSRCSFPLLRSLVGSAIGDVSFTAADTEQFGDRWKPAFQQYCRNHLRGRPRQLYSPLHHEPCRVVAETIVHGHQIYVAVHDETLFFPIFFGQSMLGIYYPSRDLFLKLQRSVRDASLALKVFLDVLLNDPVLFHAFVTRGLTGRLRPAFVIGDMRPGHFVRETLGYIDAVEDELLRFLGRGGLLVIISDGCAIDPVDVFPRLADADILRVGSARLAKTLLELGIDGHRVYRLRTHSDGAWLRKRLAARPDGMTEPGPATPRRFRIMISLDAEKRRFVNQVEAFRYVLGRLGTVCAHLGRELEVVWDGWTIAHEPRAKDIQVMRRIEEMIDEITTNLDVRLGRQIPIFGRSIVAKVPTIAGCDLVMVTQGTGAVVPNWLLQRTTIVWHVAQKVGNRSDLSEETIVQVDQRAVVETEADPAQPNAERFSIALWGMEDALVRAVGEELGLVRELTDQTTMKAGTA